MDATLAEQPPRASNRTTGTSWRPSPSLVNSLYFVVFTAGIGLAVGMTGVFLQASIHEAAAGGNAGATRTEVNLTGHGVRPAAGLDGLGDEQLKMYYLECACDSSRQRMELDEAAVCGEVADILLAYSFGGDFGRMIDWWRAQRDVAQ